MISLLGGEGIGLYFDAKCVYLAELRSQFGVIQLNHYAAEELPEGSWDDPEALTRAVASVIKKSGVTTTQANIAISEQESMVRYFEMPILPKKEWRNAIRFEAQKYVPFDVKTLYSDYNVTPDKPKKRMRVMFLAVKKKPADTLLSAARSAGLKIKALESYSLAYSRALYPDPDSQPKSIVAVLDLEKNHIQIAVMQDGLVLMTRHNILNKPAILDVAPALTDFSAISAELRLSLNYFSKNFKSLRIDQVVLCADLENEYRGLGNFLQQDSGIPVRAFNPVTLYGKQLPYSSGLVCAIGLALRDTTYKKNEKINIFTAEHIKLEDGILPLSPEDEKILFQKTIVVGFLVALVLIGLVYLAMGARIRAVRAEVLKTAGISNVPPELARASADEIKGRIAEIAKKNDFLTALVDKRTHATEKMSDLARLVPSEIHLSVFEYNDNEDNSGTSSIALRLEGHVIGAAAGGELAVLDELIKTMAGDKEFMRGLDEVKIASVQKTALDGAPALKFVLEATARPLKR